MQPTQKTSLDKKTLDKLIKAAERARERAYAPYSSFQVGAAVLCKDGSIYHGCNIENASFGLTCCAERNAIFKAISFGKRNFEAICVVLDSPQICSPCGACRQVIMEFGSHIKVIMVNRNSDSVNELAISELLTRPFGPESLVL